MKMPNILFNHSLFFFTMWCLFPVQLPAALFSFSEKPFNTRPDLQFLVESNLKSDLFFISGYRQQTQAPPAPISVDSLLELHAKAMGGKQAWLKLKTWIIIQQRKDGKVIAYAKKPNKFRLDFQLANRNSIKSYDGKDGWLLIEGVYEPMRPGEAIEMAEEPDFYGELIYAHHRRLPAKVLPPEQLNGHWCYRLQITKSPKDKQWYWINSETFLIDQTAEYSEDSAHDGILYKTIFEDYQSIDGLMFPRREGLIANDNPPRMWTLETIRLNEKIPNRFFQYPK